MRAEGGRPHPIRDPAAAGPSPALDPLGLVVLVRVAAATGGGEPLAATRRALAPHLEARGTREEARRRLGDALDGLVAWGRLDRPQGAVHVATAAGRAALEAEGLAAGPGRRAWTGARDVDLPARALGLPPPSGRDRQRFRSAAGLRAAVLSKAHRLPLPPFPTLAQAGRALAWTRLEALLGRPLDPSLAPRAGSGPLVATLAGDWLGDGRSRNLDRALGLLAARAAGAATPEPAALRRALVGRWLDGAGVAPEGAAATALPDFAREVVRLAEAAPDERFGPDCVYVAHVLDAYRRAHPTASAEGFKQRLAEANRRGLLRLQRADLVEALDAALVERSELEVLGTRFHFVRVEP